MSSGDGPSHRGALDGAAPGIQCPSTGLGLESPRRQAEPSTAWPYTIIDTPFLGRRDTRASGGVGPTTRGGAAAAHRQWLARHRRHKPANRRRLAATRGRVTARRVAGEPTMRITGRNGVAMDGSTRHCGCCCCCCRCWGNARVRHGQCQQPPDGTIMVGHRNWMPPPRQFQPMFNRQMVSTPPWPWHRHGQGLETDGSTGRWCLAIIR
mmetsp:Transcript_7172/g.13635  ORF Transcript_7172/g.13635 Transcript_7172/m.13635 type:complete len:209 (-) Transcript_7172:103-729(-)